MQSSSWQCSLIIKPGNILTLFSQNVYFLGTFVTTGPGNYFWQLFVNEMIIFRELHSNSVEGQNLFNKELSPKNICHSSFPPPFPRGESVKVAVITLTAFVLLSDIVTLYKHCVFLSLGRYVLLCSYSYAFILAVFRLFLFSRYLANMLL